MRPAHPARPHTHACAHDHTMHTHTMQTHTHTTLTPTRARAHTHTHTRQVSALGGVQTPDEIKKDKRNTRTDMHAHPAGACARRSGAQTKSGRKRCFSTCVVASVIAVPTPSLSACLLERLSCLRWKPTTRPERCFYVMLFYFIICSLGEAGLIEIETYCGCGWVSWCGLPWGSCVANTRTRADTRIHTHTHTYPRARARAHTHTHTHTHTHKHRRRYFGGNKNKATGNFASGKPTEKPFQRERESVRRRRENPRRRRNCRCSHNHNAIEKGKATLIRLKQLWFDPISPSPPRDLVPIEHHTLTLRLALEGRTDLGREGKGETEDCWEQRVHYNTEIADNKGPVPLDLL